MRVQSIVVVVVLERGAVAQSLQLRATLRPQQVHSDPKLSRRQVTPFDRLRHSLARRDLPCAIDDRITPLHRGYDGKSDRLLASPRENRR